MGKTMVVFLALNLFIVAQEVKGQGIADREFRLSPCIRYLPNGTEVVEMYDTCTSFCCGGNIVLNSTRMDCCGSVAFGSVYNPRYEGCCEWWTGHGQGHVLRYFGERISCCGTHRITWGVQSCCYGYPDPPEVFDFRRDMCCNSHRVRLAPGVLRETAACCGERAAYDRRFQSCPCGDGQVIDVADSKGACCETLEGLKTPYMPATQFCCNGEIGENGINFCCENGDGVGIIGTNVCCNGKLIAVVPPDVTKTECCNGSPFDPTVNLCCDDMVMEIIEGADQCCDGTPYSVEKSICCETRLWSTDTQGTECCSATPFFPGKDSFCCNGDVFLSEEAGGDSCCGTGASTTYYFKEENQFICCGGVLSFVSSGDQCCGTNPYPGVSEVCCDGQVFSRELGNTCCSGNPYFVSDQTICCESGPFGPFKNPKCCGGQGYDVEGGTVCCSNRVFGKYRWPACCVDEGYDAFTHECCDSTILEIPNGSNQGGCCGFNAYDKLTQLCCSGENVTTPEDIPMSRAKCCNFEVYNTDTHLCCSGFIRERTDRFSTKCCGITSYNNTEQICCDAEDGTEPLLYDFMFGRENTRCCSGILFNAEEEFCCDGFLEMKQFDLSACCNGAIYDRMTQICCGGELRNIGRVPHRRAECCGSECMFRGFQRCCNDRVYRRSILSNVTCENF